MIESYALKEQQLLHAMSVAVLACPPTVELYEYLPVMEQISAIQIYLGSSTPTPRFTDSFFCTSGCLIQKKEVVAVMRILPLTKYQYRVRVYRSGYPIRDASVTQDRKDQWYLRRQAAGGVLTYDLFSGDRMY